MVQIKYTLSDWDIGSYNSPGMNCMIKGEREDEGWKGVYRENKREKEREKERERERERESVREKVFGGKG